MKTHRNKLQPMNRIRAIFQLPVHSCTNYCIALEGSRGCDLRLCGLAGPVKGSLKVMECCARSWIGLGLVGWLGWAELAGAELRKCADTREGLGWPGGK